MFVISQLWIRLLGAGLSLIALAFFVNPILLGIRHVGCYIGTIICILGILFFAFNSVIAKFLKNIWENEFGHVVLCVILGVLGFGTILAVILSILMIHAEFHKPKEPTTVVILGCKVRNDGEPTLMLKKRLEAGIEYLTQNPEISVIVCGGQGADEVITEAECMSNYLIKNGIAPERIYQENISSSTQENLANAKKILEQQDLENNIIIVTDGYHQYRASKIASSLDLSVTAISAKTSWYLVPSYWVREWLGICYLFVFG